MSKPVKVNYKKNVEAGWHLNGARLEVYGNITRLEGICFQVIKDLRAKLPTAVIAVRADWELVFDCDRTQDCYRIVVKGNQTAIYQAVRELQAA